MWYSNCDKSITLIRHGKTFANEKGLYCGFSDIELSEDGIASLYEIKKAKIYPDFDLYITSGMKRANKTMDILFGKPYIVDENFKEINFGDFELKSYYELREDKSYLKWIENIEKNKIPNGESKIEFKERIFKAFKDTYHRDIKNIAIILS